LKNSLRLAKVAPSLGEGGERTLGGEEAVDAGIEEVQDEPEEAGA